MTVRELMNELAKHSLDMDVVVGTGSICYADNIREVGVRGYYKDGEMVDCVEIVTPKEWDE